MRIAIWHNLPSGGGKRALHYHVRGLVERGYTVEAWCPPTADRNFLPLGDIIPEHALPLAWKPRSQKNPVSRLLSNYYNTIDKIYSIDQHCQLCAEEINRGNFDLLIVHPCRFLRVSPIGKYVRIPKVLYLQEPYRYLYEALPQLPWLALPSSECNVRTFGGIKNCLIDLFTVYGLRVQAREETNNARSYDQILVNSFYSRESVLRAYGTSANVCYLGVDTKIFINLHRKRENYVVGVGAFVPAKNIEFVIEAISLVSSPRPKLIWIGNAAVQSYLDELINLSKHHNVDFEPRIGASDPELVGILNDAKLMAYAPRLEPFGFAPLEANACGLTVVAVAEGGVRETIIDGFNGLLVEGDPQAMAEGINKLIEDQTLLQQLEDNGSKHVNDFWTLAASIDRLENRITDLLGSN